MNRKEVLLEGVVKYGGQEAVANGLELYILPRPLGFLEWACTNGFVFHGSSRKILGDLVPNQANDEVKESGNRKAVYMTKTPPLVMFTALAGGRKVGRRNSQVFLEITDKGGVEYPKPPEFGVERLEELAEEGYVYIFDKNSQIDEEINGECLSYKPIKPLAIIRIKRVDFRFSIEKI